MNLNTPIEEEVGRISIEKNMWVWDNMPTQAIYLFVKNQSNKKVYKFSGFDNNNRFVANFKNANILKPQGRE